MALILCLESATEVCSVALADNSVILSSEKSSEPNVHSSQLTVFIGRMMERAGFSLSDLDAVAVSKGPGSYTGIRIGVSVAKGLCYSLDKPLIAVPTLEALAHGMESLLPPSGSSPTLPVLLCPMIDARRMEVYTALFDSRSNMLRETEARIIEADSYNAELSGNKVWFAGSGASKCKALLGDHPNAVFPDAFTAAAEYLAPLAEERFTKRLFENIAYFEPFYLKDFVAGKPRVKGLH